LAGISRDDLKYRVSSFCREHSLVEKEDVFFRGALVAQSPEDYSSIPELTEDERSWLSREITHKWDLPKTLYYTIALCSLGSAIQGWDNTGANGANLSFPKEFGIEHNSWLIGCINAAPTLFGLLSSWAADPVNNLLGRRGTIFVTGLFCIFPVLGQGFTRNWWELLLCRLLMGLGMGIKISTIPVYTAEVSPASIRGGLVTSFQMWVSFGMFVGYATNLIFYKVGRLAWRFQLAAAFAPAIPVVICVWFCPGKSTRLLLFLYLIE
jgi:MFS family permease